MLDLRLKMADVEVTNEMNVGKGKYMAEWRIFHRFYNLFDLNSLEYTSAHTQFLYNLFF